MLLHRLSFSTIIKKKVYHKITGSVLLVIVIFLFIQALSINTKPDKPITEQPGLIGFLGTITVILIIFGLLLNFIASYYRSKYDEKANEAIFYADKVEFLQSVRNRVIIGLENIRSYIIPDFQEEKFLTTTTVPAMVLDYFSLEIQCELQAEIKGKTIFTLIEIAYQDPVETNPTKLARNLKMSLSSLSREIKKLISLNYLETHISDVVLEDARLRNFKITQKGFIFLSNLNDALKMTIDRLKKREAEKENKNGTFSRL